MKTHSMFSILLLGTLFCIVYFDTCNGNAVASSDAAAAASDEKAITKPGNNSAPVSPSTLSRARRQACHGAEPPGHRCRNDCHCGRDRYCSSNGYCHARNRDRRLSYPENVEYIEQQENYDEDGNNSPPVSAFKKNWNIITEKRLTQTNR